MSATKRPKKSAGDTAHVIVKAALSAVPVAGGPLAELFAYLIDEPVKKRRDDWIEEIASRLEDLRARLGDHFVEQLKDNVSFTTVLLNASQIAVRNHQREKIEALANAVLNTALGMTPDETERAIMLDLVDRLTPTHVALIGLFQDPRRNRAVAERMRSNVLGGGLTQVIVTAYPELRGRNELVNLIWRDLESAHLIGQGGAINTMMTGSGMLEKRTTAFGDRFLAFIGRNDQERRPS
jgi:hypothetical protein